MSFNIENPEADSEKGRPTNSCIFLLNSESLDITIFERQYRIERDEQAFIEMMQKNMGSQAQMEQFLNNRAGGMGEGKELDDLIPKRKIPVPNVEPKIVFEGSIPLQDFHKGQSSRTAQPFEVELQRGLVLTGLIKLVNNEFTHVPRGELDMKVEQVSVFKKDRYEAYKDIVMLFTKEIA